MANLGVPYDGVRGKAARQEVADWCKGVGLPMSFSCSFKQLGEQFTNLVAAEWCRNMQYFYDFWRARSGPGSVWSAECVHGFGLDPDFEAAVIAQGTTQAHQRAEAIPTMAPQNKL